MGGSRMSRSRRHARRRSGEHRWTGALALGLLGLSLVWPIRLVSSFELGEQDGADAAELPDSGPEGAQVPAPPDEPRFLQQIADAHGEALGSEAGIPELHPEGGHTPRAVSSPARQRTLYELAGLRYGVSPRILRALHAVESDLAPGRCLANLEGSGALGPFQFMPATFRAYGVDADGDGRADVCGLVDSLFSAARYLNALGADDDPASATTHRALSRYGTDPELVMRLARLLAPLHDQPAQGRLGGRAGEPRVMLSLE